MKTPQNPKPIRALDILPTSGTNYPAPFNQVVDGREKRKLGEAFGLSNFGVNLTVLAPGAASALFHRHSRQDEFIYVLSGQLCLCTGDDEMTLSSGECAGFPAGGAAHQLVNRSDAPASYLEIGDRTPGDQVTYPNDDLAATLGPDGNWVFTRKDGSSS